MSRCALITGASSGIGKEFALRLSEMGYGIIATARRKDRLIELQQEIGEDMCDIYQADLCKPSECISLFNAFKDYDITVVINCAGFGMLGEFCDIPLEKEMEMINVNVCAVQVLTKLFLKKFTQKDKGYILNVASSAGLMSGGPYMATYYATKSYVTDLSLAVARELKLKSSNVYVGALCPGPVDTEFNEVANASFSVQSISAKECVNYALKKMFARKTLIVPNFTIRALTALAKFIPRKLVVALTGSIQESKME